MKNYSITVAACLIAASACAATTAQKAASVGSQALGCPTTQTIVNTIDDHRYEASGCGHVVTVSCDDSPAIDCKPDTVQ